MSRRRQHCTAAGSRAIYSQSATVRIEGAGRGWIELRPLNSGLSDTMTARPSPQEIKYGNKRLIIIYLLCTQLPSLSL